MISQGIHIGLFTIRISQCFQKQGDKQLSFRPVTLPAYGIDDWWPYFQGALPNCFDPVTNKIGYEALGPFENFDPNHYRRFDEEYFQSLLSNGKKSHPYQEIWANFLTTLIKDFSPNFEIKRFALYLEGVYLIDTQNSWPLGIENDRKKELVENLNEISKDYGIEEVIVLDERKITESFVSNNYDIKPYDLLLNLGSDRSSLWLIKDARKGEIDALENCQGYNNLIQQNSMIPTDFFLKLLAATNDKNNSFLENLNSITDQWYKNNIKPVLGKAWARIEKSSQKEISGHKTLWISGEGKCLIRKGAEKFKFVDQPQYWYANTASQIMFENNKQEGYL